MGSRTGLVGSTLRARCSGVDRGRDKAGSARRSPGRGRAGPARARFKVDRGKPALARRKAARRQVMGARRKRAKGKEPKARLKVKEAWIKSPQVRCKGTNARTRVRDRCLKTYPKTWCAP